MYKRQRHFFLHIWMILVLFYVDYIAGNSELKRHSKPKSWKDSFEECNFGGADLFQNCDANTCDASLAKNRIKDSGYGILKEYWVNGFVQRSPVLAYEGCFLINTSQMTFKEVVVNPNERFNIVRDCVSINSSMTYIFLQKISNDSSPLTKVRCFVGKETLGTKEPYANCDKQCGDNYSTLCGGFSHEVEAYFSVYRIQKLELSSPVGKSCFMSQGIKGDRKAKAELCRKQLARVCQEYSFGTPKPHCNNILQNWFRAQHFCLEDKRHLTEEIDSSCMENGTDYWIGHFAVETVTWGKENVPNNAYCLKLVLWENKGEDTYDLKLENCTRELHPLCVIEDDTAKNKTHNSYTTLTSTGWFSATTDKTHTTIDNTPDPMSTTEEIVVKVKKDEIVGAAIGGAVGGLVCFVLLVVACICKRNRQLIGKRSSEVSNVQMEMQNRNERSASQLLGDLNTTEEGVYNHLGDGEAALKVDNGVYDLSGTAENEYDVSTSRDKHGGDSDLYDRAATSGDEYSTLQNKNQSSGKHIDTNNEYDF